MPRLCDLGLEVSELPLRNGTNAWTFWVTEVTQMGIVVVELCSLPKDMPEP